MRAATADRSLLTHAAQNRGETWIGFNRFTLHPAPMRTGTTAGFLMEAQCKGEFWSPSRASTLAPASQSVFTTMAELLKKAARWRGVSWVGNRVEKQIKNYWSSSHQYMIYLMRISVLIHFLFKCAPWHGCLFVMVSKSMSSICNELSKTKHR